MVRDKIYGALIFIVAVVIILWYTWWTLYFGAWIGTQVDSGATTIQLWLALTSGNPYGALGPHSIAITQYYLSTGFLSWIPVPPRFLSVAIPIWLAVTLILAIAAWIGYTMMTTPPPVPLEELEKTEEKTKEKDKKEKKEKP